MGLEGQHDQPGGAAVATDGLIEIRGPERSGPGIGIIGARHDEERGLQLVGSEKVDTFR